MKANPQRPDFKPSEDVTFFIPDNGREPNNGLGGLTIRVQDDENITTYLSNLLGAGCAAKLTPFSRSLSWKQYRQVVMPGVRQFWEELTGAHRQHEASHPRNQREYCFDLIYRVIDKWYETPGVQTCRSGRARRSPPIASRS